MPVNMINRNIRSHYPATVCPLPPRGARRVITKGNSRRIRCNDFRWRVPAGAHLVLLYCQAGERNEEASLRDILLELAGLALVFLLVAGIAAWKASRDEDSTDGDQDDRDS